MAKKKEKYAKFLYIKIEVENDGEKYYLASETADIAISDQEKQEVAIYKLDRVTTIRRQLTID